MNIGLLNDLHLEGSNVSKLINPGWDVLVIAGDLSSENSLIDQFFAYKAPDNIPIIYVLGNHEYEGKRADKVVDNLKELMKPYENVHILDNESIIIDNVKFIGSTLWTNFELEGIESKKEDMKWAKQNIVDFTYIFTEKEHGKYTSLTPEEMVKWNEKAIEFLDFELRHNSFDGEKVVITHFAPHPKSIHERHKGAKSSYWVNNLEHLMGFSQYWLHGHTHNSFNYEIEGTKVQCNPRGYSKLLDLSSNHLYDKDLILPIIFEKELNNITKQKIKI